MNLYTFQIEYKKDIDNIYNILINTFSSKNIILNDKENFYRDLLLFLYKKNINLKI
jgi:hypothetical protein